MFFILLSSTSEIWITEPTIIWGPLTQEPDTSSETIWGPIQTEPRKATIWDNQTTIWITEEKDTFSQNPSDSCAIWGPLEQNTSIWVEEPSLNNKDDWFLRKNLMGKWTGPRLDLNGSGTITLVALENGQATIIIDYITNKQIISGTWTATDSLFRFDSISKVSVTPYLLTYENLSISLEGFPTILKREM